MLDAGAGGRYSAGHDRGAKDGHASARPASDRSGGRGREAGPLRGLMEYRSPPERSALWGWGFWRSLTAPQLFVGSFLGLIAVGTAVLLLVPGLYTGEGLSFVDALFTATSAVCVTGLIVVDTATYFTPLGQGVILVLIQLGGLGILTFTTLIILLLGRRLTLRAEMAVGAPEAIPDIDASGLLRTVLRYTFVIEGIGAVLLWLAWTDRFGWIGAVWPAVFHAVSAFCNAGFSIFSDSLESFAAAPFALTVVMILIVLGGIGFVVLEELRLRGGGRRTGRLSLHTQLVLLATVLFLVGGGLLYAAFEWTNVLEPMAWYLRPVHAFFMSVTARTAGFNTVDYAELTSASLLLTMVLMLIGGAPGSTAGGLKTTTVMLLGFLAMARARGRTVTSAFRRTIPEGTIQRAIGLLVFVMALLGVALFLLQITELQGVPHPLSRGLFLELAFEVVSAFDTVGLSTGLTADLSPAGKSILVFLMFIGRVGPFTLVASMIVAAEHTKVRYRYATEDVIIG